MLINKNGQIIANASQPTVVFNTQADYDTWAAKVGAANLSKFVIIKTYEIVEEDGCVIYKTDLTAINALTGTDVHTKALYIAADTLKAYQLPSAGNAVEVSKAVEIVSALPAFASAKENIVYINSSNGAAQVKGASAMVDVAKDVMTSASFDTSSTADPSMYGKFVVNTTTKKLYFVDNAGAISAVGATAAEFYATTGSFPGTDATNFPKLTSLPSGYAVEDRFFVDREKYSLYVIKNDPDVSGGYMYQQISQVLDNVEIVDFINEANAKTFAVTVDATAKVTQTGVLYFCTADNKFYEFNGTAAVEKKLTFAPAAGDVDDIYAATMEGMMYVYKDGNYVPVGGADEVQTYTNVSDFPAVGQGGKLYISTAEAQCYIYNGGKYEVVSARATILYASKSAFPAEGKDGMIYIAKDTGKMYYWDSTVTGTDKYVEVGDVDDVHVYDTKAALDTDFAAGKLHTDVLYVAKDTLAQYIVSGSELLCIGTTIKSYTQAEYDALTVKPEVAWVTGGLYDAIGFGGSL